MGQTKKIAEANFLKIINEITKNCLTTDPSSLDENDNLKIQDENDLKILVVAPFSINKKGILSITTKYKDEKGRQCFKKKTIPVDHISTVYYDLYIGLEGLYTDSVTTYRKKPNSSIFEKDSTNELFEIGFTNKGEEQQIKLYDALVELKKYYY